MKPKYVMVHHETDATEYFNSEQALRVYLEQFPELSSKTDIYELKKLVVNVQTVVNF